jgi:peptidoglycan/LPS O-acetylase OafA/YrhL
MTQVQVSIKNNVELWRFAFTIGVVVMHFGYYNGYYIAVDFFFMLSGFLLMCSLDSIPAERKTIFGFIKKRLIRIYPHYLFSLFVMIGVLVHWLAFGIQTIISAVFSFFGHKYISFSEKK